MKTNFGEYIRLLRKKNGFTLTQLGAQLNIDSGALSKIETGKKLLDESSLPKLAKIFSLDLNELKDEYFSEKIANEIYKNNCSDKVLTLAEEKVNYIRNNNVRQGKLNLTS
ncbi:MAG: helix-turn-helix domain-containing protein [Bacteroidales bacterium]|nr:helix-turn-helix domain-containing protein [Bacteroidales bacterium]